MPAKSSKLRKDRMIKEHSHDTYKSPAKNGSSLICDQCGAVYKAGRWTWSKPPIKAILGRCPACHRIKDRYPAGVLSIKGDYAKVKKEEILNLIMNEQTKAKHQHPLNRIMDISSTSKKLEITFTDAHLPRRIGEALHHAHQGTLNYKYSEGDKFIRVNWIR